MPQSKGKRARHDRWLKKQQENGLERTQVRVPASKVTLIHHVADAIRRGAVVLLSPADGKELLQTNTGKDKMQNIESPWTTASLKTAFEESSLIDSEEFKVEIVDGASPVLKVTANEFGDIELYVSVVEEQILTSVLLCKRSDIAEQAELEGMMLRNHKTILPLSAFGITTVAGEEWYEIFGAMSARSPISAFVTEVRTIANNAVEVVTELLADLMVQQAA